MGPRLSKATRVLAHVFAAWAVMYAGFAAGAAAFGRPALAFGRPLATSSLAEVLGVCQLWLDERSVAGCLEAIGTSQSIDPRTADMLRLRIHAVAAEKLRAAAHAEQATALCQSLEWPACDRDAIAAMGGREP
jgi:hypothetical protein